MINSGSAKNTERNQDVGNLKTGESNSEDVIIPDKEGGAKKSREMMSRAGPLCRREKIGTGQDRE